MLVLETQSLQNLRNVSTLEITTVYPQKVHSEIIWKEIGPSEPEFLGKLSRKDVEQKDFWRTVRYFLVKTSDKHYCVFFHSIVQTVNGKIHFTHFQDIVPVVEVPTFMGICVQSSY